MNTDQHQPTTPAQVDWEKLKEAYKLVGKNTPVLMSNCSASSARWEAYNLLWDSLPTLLATYEEPAKVKEDKLEMIRMLHCKLDEAGAPSDLAGGYVLNPLHRIECLKAKLTTAKAALAQSQEEVRRLRDVVTAKIQGQDVRDYIEYQFPATIGHIPLQAWLKAQHDVLTTPSAPATSGVEALHPATETLVREFAADLRAKLLKSQEKYGYGASWQNLGTTWSVEDCQKELMKHIVKGDPRDVAAYCAFLWAKGFPTAPSTVEAEAEKFPEYSMIDPADSKSGDECWSEMGHEWVNVDKNAALEWLHQIAVTIHKVWPVRRLKPVHTPAVRETGKLPKCKSCGCHSLNSASFKIAGVCPTCYESGNHLDVPPDAQNGEMGKEEV